MSTDALLACELWRLFPQSRARSVTSASRRPFGPAVGSFRPLLLETNKPPVGRHFPTAISHGYSLFNRHNAQAKKCTRA